jgi:chromosome segregation ATPase
MLKDWLRRVIGNKLEDSIQTKQDVFIRLDANIRAKEQDLAKITAKLSELEAQQKSEIDALDLEEMLVRGRLQAEIVQFSEVKEDLAAKIVELQDRWQNSQAALVQIDRQVSELEERKTQLLIALNGLDKLLEQKQTLVRELDNAILDRQQNRFNSEISVDNQLETITSQVETPQDLDIDEENKLEDLPPIEELSSTSKSSYRFD